MDYSSLLALCVVSFCTLLAWKCSYIVYCLKWVCVYAVLRWRRWSVDPPLIPVFCSQKEEYLEKPRIWSKEKPFERDSMLVWAGGTDCWLLLELARGRHNSARARVCLQLTTNGPVYQTTGEECGPRACDGWQTDRLTLQCLEPMRRWRVVFCGRLHSSEEGRPKSTKLVKMHLMWIALGRPYCVDADADLSALTSALAAQPWPRMQDSLRSLGKGYEQWGVVQGSVSVDDSVTSIHAPALRRHIWQWPHANTSVVGVADNGTLFTITYTSTAIRSQLGHVRYPDGREETVVGTSPGDTPALRDKFVITFSSVCVDHTAYTVRGPVCQWGGLGWARASATLDSQLAVCLVLSWNRQTREDFPWLPLLENSTTDCNNLVLTLDHPSCSNPAVVGGKAASLALLHDTSKTILRNMVVVPPGFCLTVEAMRVQAQSSESLCSAVKFLSLISSGQQVGNLQEECQHVVSAWQGVPMCPAVAAAVSERVVPGRVYAVRSSGLTEDTADTSAAGQNTTVLGCVGVAAVIAAVHQCWASLYSYQSVQYRRQCGLPVESVLAVVIQELVEPEAAGVMFTRHPVTADPARLLITANYGLGETVVSGRVEPDTVTVDTERPGHLTVVSAQRGAKASRMVLSDDGGVCVEAVAEELSQSLCLSEPEVIALAQVGLVLERACGGPRDIEWAINKGVIYLVQCRPITSLLAWTPDELTHELDSAILPGDVSTLANLGEVLPGATSPLGQSTTLRITDFVMMRRFCGIRPNMWYNNNRLVVSHHHYLMHFYNTLLIDARPEPSLQQNALEVAVCGHRVSTPDMQAAAARRTTPVGPLTRAMAAAHMIWTVVMNGAAARKAQRVVQQVQLDCDTFTTAAGLYDYLTHSHTHAMEVFRLHARVSTASTVWQIILFTVLAEGKSDLSEDNVQDIAGLLAGKQTSVSMQIPNDIKALIDVIKTCDRWPELTRLAPDKMAAWLALHCPAAARLLEDIIQRYQHRNIKELDVMSVTWGLDSTPLMAMIQTTLQTPTHTDTDGQPGTQRPAQRRLQLRSPLTRLAVRWLVGVAGAAAARRELTKDVALRLTHSLRLGYLQLARLLYAEGRLPHPSLVWMCTHYELGLLLRYPQPSLLLKIQRRQRCWRGWDELQFPEVMTGPPAPVQFTSHPSTWQAGGVCGTLVCGGEVRGRACVLLSPAQAPALRPGDVLITHSTDVGWTPLFPLITGVVTELGGLISHGAVVAREYGLPCVVGATNATVVFKTGDEVYLDGRTGNVLKVSAS